MIVDIRYHVASLVAVFLALGLGIIIGANLGRTVNLQIEKQIDRLEQMYQKNQKDLQAALQSKDNELEIDNQFQKAIIPSLIANRLVGKRIAIIRTNDSVNFGYAKQIVNFLRQAGAEVTTITSITKAFDLADPETRTDLENAFDLKTVDDHGNNASNLFPELASRIIQIITQGQGTFQLLFLQNKNLIQLWGDYDRGYTDTVIFLGGGTTLDSDHQNEIDQPLVNAAEKIPGLTLIGVEPSFVTDSYMRLYQSKCQGTIDDIDNPPGELTLVYLLASGKGGFFGIKDSARKLMPDFRLNY